MDVLDVLAERLRNTIWPSVDGKGGDAPLWGVFEI